MNRINKTSSVREQKEKVIIGEGDWQQLYGLFRVFLLITIPLAIGLYGGATFDQIKPNELTESIVQYFPLFVLIRPFIWLLVATLQSWRWWFIPVATTAGVFLSAAMFLRDIYDLKTTRNAVRYLIGSMFALSYPTLTIDKGVKLVDKHEENLLAKIGGPGIVLIEPGNAAMFRSLREPSGVSLTATYFLPPFDTIAQVVSLEEQQADKDEIGAMTRDGIKVVIRDIHFRYRINHKKGKNGISERPSLATPYPILDEAIENMTFNLSVQSDGLDKWNAAVERVVVGAITDFVAANYIDFLTAPRDGTRNPRIEIKNELFRGIQNALAGLGAELLWIDAGHVDVIDPMIENSRTHMWAAEWVDDANAIKAFGEAKRAAYQELGRAEAHAELIMSITDVVAKAAQDSGGSIDIRKVLLMRTAQILDMMTEKNKAYENGRENVNGKGGK